MMTPRIEYARTSDGANIAYYAIGEGPPLVYLTPMSQLDLEWAYPEQRSWLERLAAKRRLIRLDHRASGLSTRDCQFSPELSVRDIDAVVRRERLTRFAIMGQLHSAATAILYASEHPAAVSRLLLWRPYARVRRLLQASPALQAARAAARFDWITFTELMAQHATGWRDADQARRYAAYLRESADASQYEPAMARLDDLDVTEAVARLTMTVLIIHRRGTRFPTIDVVREMIALAPDARLLLLDGAEGVPFLGDTDSVEAAIDDFLVEDADAAGRGPLSERESEILELLAAGRSNEQIATALSISTRTVERHIGNIYRKIGAHNRAEATAYAFRHHLVRAP